MVKFLIATAILLTTSSFDAHSFDSSDSTNFSNFFDIDDPNINPGFNDGLIEKDPFGKWVAISSSSAKQHFLPGGHYRCPSQTSPSGQCNIGASATSQRSYIGGTNSPTHCVVTTTYWKCQ